MERLMPSKKLVVISGGSQGLGSALAKEYVQRDCDVVIVARTEAKLREAAERLGPSVTYVAADVSLPAECARVFATVPRVPDVVVCAAGAAQPGFFLELTPEELAKNQRTVYDTAMYFSHAALRVMTAAPDKYDSRRHLVYCSSTVAIFPFIGYSAYAPSKAAIRSLSDIVRQECLEHNIRVSHILPGTMDTEGYAIEEMSKPAITKQIEGASVAAPAAVVARQIAADLDRGHDTIYTDTVSWVLGSMMMGASPRAGLGILQTIVGLFLVIFGPIIAWSVNGDIRKANELARRPA